MVRSLLFIISISAVFAKLDESLLTEELRSLMVTLHNTCVDQIQIAEAVIDQIKIGAFNEDQKTKCYVKCVLSESGVMDENGDIDMAAFAEVIPAGIRAKAKGVFEECTKLGEGVTGECEKAFKIVQCTYEKDPENYFFV